MEYRRIPNTDLDVSKICLGTMTWGKQNSEAEGHEQMNYALDQGVNFWDTAELYPVPAESNTQGATEEIIGNWLRLCLLISISKIIIQISRNDQYRTFWGPLLVCDDGWGSEEAQVACR